MTALVGAGGFSAGTDSSTPAWGSGRSAGNLLLAAVFCGDAAESTIVNSLSGWSAIPRVSSASGHSYSQLFWRQAQGADSPPSFSCADSATFLAAALLELTTGAPAIWTLDSATATATATSGSSLTVTTAAPATGSNVALGLWMQSQASGTVTLTPSSGWTNASQYTATGIYHAAVDLLPGAPVAPVAETETASGTSTLLLGQICIFDSSTNVVTPESGAAGDDVPYIQFEDSSGSGPLNYPFDVGPGD